MNGELSG